MSEFMRNCFPLKSTELPCFKNGHVPHRMSPHLDTVFIDVLIVDGQSIKVLWLPFTVNKLEFG